jgi:hypothetical protein
MATDLTLLPYDFADLQTELINEIRTYPEWQDVSVDDTILQMVSYMFTYYTSATLANINKTFTDYFPSLTGSEDVVELFANFIGMTVNRKLGALGKKSVDISDPLYPNGNSVKFYIDNPALSIFVGAGVEISNGADIIFTTTSTGTIPAGVGTQSAYIEVIQGQYKTVSFTSTGQASQIFFLNELNVDDTQFSVNTSVGGTYTRQNNFLFSTRTSKDYILNYTKTGFYFKFGDGITGAIPALGETITLTYLVTLASAGDIYSANVITTVNTQLVDSGNNPVDVLVTNPYPMLGGYDGDSIDAIKANITRYFMSTPYVYRRADYIAYLLAYPDVLDVNLYAGWELYPLDTTKWFTIFIYPVPKTGHTINNNLLLTYLKQRELFFSYIFFGTPVYVPINNTIDISLNPKMSISQARINAILAEIQTLVTDFYDYETVVASNGTIFRDIYSSQIAAQVMAIPEIIKSDVYLQTVENVYTVQAGTNLYNTVAVKYIPSTGLISGGTYLYLDNDIVGIYTDYLNTGLVTIAVDSTLRKFTRSAGGTGSFLLDGFVAGQTIVTSGFTNSGNNGTFVILTVNTTEIVCTTAATSLVTEPAVTGRRIRSSAGTSTLLTLNLDPTYYFSNTAASIAVDSGGKTFIRAAGSFTTDGFVTGQTIMTSGFTNEENNGQFVISNVSQTVNPGDTITCSTAVGLVTETTATGRTLTSTLITSSTISSGTVTVTYSNAIPEDGKLLYVRMDPVNEYDIMQVGNNMVFNKYDTTVNII